MPDDATSGFVPREIDFLDVRTEGIYPPGHQWDVGNGETISDADVEAAGPFSLGKQRPPGPAA